MSSHESAAHGNWQIIYGDEEANYVVYSTRYSSRNLTTPRLQNATPHPRQLPCASGRFLSALRLLVTDVFLSRRKLSERKLASLRRCTRRAHGRPGARKLRAPGRAHPGPVRCCCCACKTAHTRVRPATRSAARKLCAVLSERSGRAWTQRESVGVAAVRVLERTQRAQPTVNTALLPSPQQR